MFYRVLSLRLLNGFILNFFLYLLQFITMQFAATSIYQSSWSCTRQKHKYVCKYMFSWIRQINAIPTVMQYLFQLFSFVSCSSGRVAFQFRFAIVVFSFSLSLSFLGVKCWPSWSTFIAHPHTYTNAHTHTGSKGNSQALSKHTWAAKIARHTSCGGSEGSQGRGLASQRGQPGGKCNLWRESCAHTKLWICD